MKRLIQFLMLIVLGLCAPQLLAANAAVQGFCSNGGVKVVTQGMNSTTTVQASYPKCIVTVYLTGTTTKATIYPTSGGGTLGNPFTAATNAGWLFYAATGVGYDIVMSGGAPISFPEPFTLTDVMAGGGSGGGGTPAPPQFAVQLANQGATNFAADSLITINTTSHALNGYLTNGSFNSDVAQTGGGNNGIANLEAGPCASGGCFIVKPGNSTSTEATIPTVNNTHIGDYSHGSRADNYLNPVAGGPGGFNPYGNSGSGGGEILTTWNDPNLDLTDGAVQTSFNIYPTFNGPGYYWGANYPVAGSPVGHGLFMRIVGSTPSIMNAISVQSNTYKGGDQQSGTFYNVFDGASTGGGDEGVNDFILHRDQNSTWFHGTVNAGATPGTTMLQTTNVAGPLSRTPYAVNGYMLDTTRGVGTFFTAGVTTQVPGYQVFSTPLTTALPSASTAVGKALTAIPPPPNKISAVTATVFTIDPAYSGSASHGLFTTGTACMVAGLYQTVNITAVSAANTPSAGQQTVTYTYSKPALITEQPSLWQGGPCGDYEVPFLFDQTAPQFGIPYAIVGATDTTHIVGRLFSGAASPQAIPNNWSIATANVQLLNLSVSGTTVTATVSTSQPFTWNGIVGATVSSATNSSFNGTTGAITTINGNQLQWTQTGPTGTSASALITMPQNQFAFFLIPGAEVVNPCTSAGCPLAPNSVQWTSGDNVENMLNPSQRGNALTLEETLNSPSFGTNNASAAVGVGAVGRGINGTYTAFTFSNGNPCTIYIGCGGLLSPPQGINLRGSMGPVFSTDPPLDGSSVFTIRPRFSQQGGATSTNPIGIMLVNAGGTAGSETYVQSTGEFNFSLLATQRIRSTILSTGLGRTGNNAVAMTSANAGGVSYGAMGLYANFGNEAILDNSATVSAKAFYSGLLYAGALTPTSLGSPLIVGTPGSSTYSYKFTSVTQNGESLPTGSVTTTTGNATLSSTNFIQTAMLPGYGAQTLNVYRTAAPGGYSLGLICTNIAPGTGTCHDTGQAATAQQPPTVDTSGQVQSPSGVFGTSLVVAGQNVCQVNGTNCPTPTPLPVGSATTTAATSDAVTVAGMTSSGHCSLAATNATAATNIATTYISAKTVNQITLTHTAIAGMTYDAVCTPY